MVDAELLVNRLRAALVEIRDGYFSSDVSVRIAAAALSATESDHILAKCPKDGCRACRSFPDAPLYGKVLRDGTAQWQMKCPGCQTWGDIDDDQHFGRVSIDCPNCEYHETRNLHTHGYEIGYIKAAANAGEGTTDG